MKTNMILVGIIISALLILSTTLLIKKYNIKCPEEYTYKYEAHARFKQVFGPIDTEEEQRQVNCIVYGECNNNK